MGFQENHLEAAVEVAVARIHRQVKPAATEYTAARASNSFTKALRASSAGEAPRSSERAEGHANKLLEHARTFGLEPEG